MTNPVSYTKLADAPSVEDQVGNFTIPVSAFTAGSNTIAVEVHQQSVSSSDISFNLQLLANDAFAATLVRGPYLNRGGQSTMTVRWRTTTAVASRLEIGTVFGVYPTVLTNATPKTEHELVLTGLEPDTKYYYRVGNTVLTGANDPDRFFVTLPSANTTRKLRFAVFGDCGRDQNGFQSGALTQYRAYLAANTISEVDGMLLLGDNAYDNGTDAEFTDGFFDVYSSNILKNHKIYPSPGNHEYANAANPTSRTIAYYQSFTMPANGELGGVSSGTEAFYSFDAGDIHFISLDSYGMEAGNTRLYDTTGVQALWLKSDLAATNKKWVIAFFHHPPYTKGSHNSDTEADLRAIRENFIRILERNGVDMVLCGHSHNYERSYLLKGYYKATAAGSPLTESNFSIGAHAVGSSNGKYDGSSNSCVYTTGSGKYNHGTVYVVSGSAGADGGVQTDYDGYPHNALPNSIDDGGMFYFEVEKNRLDAKFIRRTGEIADQFTIMKDVNQKDTIDILEGEPITLTASWPGTYHWSTGATTASITVTPAAGINNYTVNDSLSCINDQVVVYANVCNTATNTWVGKVSTAWENPQNWSCNTVPGEATDVIIDHGSPNTPVISSNVVIKSITTSRGVSVVVGAGFTLRLTGN
ncbi:MAG: metallophosphoesterase [Chitinophagaceae bacterium]|nr:metallophosphoesterase [Chitinophagaceae bacterium]